MAEIVFDSVSKVYEEDAGLFDLSLRIERGESFGLLGPSGAGKSTALSLLMGFIRPDEGEAAIGGLPCFEKRHKLMSRIGYLPKDADLPARISGEGFIRLMARARGGVGSSRIQELTERLDLNPLGDLAYMAPENRRKVLLVIALMHGADILLLDDPFAGLDPTAQHALAEILSEEREKGKTIVLSSHVFEQVQRCCDRAAIIRRGRLVTVQPTQALALTRQKVYHITFDGVHQASAFAQEWGAGVELIGNRAIVAVPSSPQALIRTLAGYAVLDLVGGREELEDSFLRAFGGDLL